MRALNPGSPGSGTGMKKSGKILPKTQGDLARLAGVTRVTVNKALAGHASVNSETRERICLLARELGYRPNAAARAMVTRQSKAIGALLINTDPAFRLYNLTTYEIILGINARLQEDGYLLNLVNVADLGDDTGRQSRVFTEHLVDGLIAIGRIPDAISRHVQEMPVPCIWADGNTWSAEHCIRRDERQAAALAVDELVRLGYREIVFFGSPTLSGPDMHYSMVDRHEGARSAALERGLPFREMLLDRDDAAAWEPGRFKKILSKTTGIVTGDAVFARRLSDLAVLHWGLKAGLDYGMDCCDDSRMILQFYPQLCRVSFSRFDLGFKAGEMMLDCLRQPEPLCPSQKLSGQWISGETAQKQPVAAARTAAGTGRGR